MNLPVKNKPLLLQSLELELEMQRLKLAEKRIVLQSTAIELLLAEIDVSNTSSLYLQLEPKDRIKMLQILSVMVRPDTVGNKRAEAEKPKANDKTETKITVGWSDFSDITDTQVE